MHPPQPAPAVVTRFAPSPTGPLHLGHAYAALVAHHVARTAGGTFLLRIEDLDLTRSRAEFEPAIHADLAWLGLAPDERPVRQSERFAAYSAALGKLEDLGLTYPCFCTRKDIAAEIAQMGQAPHASPADPDGTPVYPGTCRALTPTERLNRAASGTPHVTRLDMERAIARSKAFGPWPLCFFEAWGAGSPKVIGADPVPFGDIVLARKDVGASYHLAVVVDDAAAGVTAVTRGEDLFAATHVHVLLQRLLGHPAPAYGHHALVRDAKGKRLAKRDQARALSELRGQGWTRERVIASLLPLPDAAPLISAITSR